MNPDREHIDDEVSSDVDVVADFRTWLKGPPRQRKRDVFAVVGGVVVLGGTMIVGPESAGGTVLLGGLAATVVTQGAEVLPLGAVNSARFLRVVGLLTYVALIVWMVTWALGR